MRNTEFKTKIEDNFDAFFDREIPPDYAPLQNSVTETKPSQREKAALLGARPPVADFVRQALLFFPGTYILYFISMGTAILAGELMVGKHDFRFHPNLVYVYLLALIAVFMTWHGLGDLKNKRHFVIPASIVLTGGALGVLVGATEDLIRLSSKIAVDFEYAIWLFPLGLIVPFLAKGWIDRKSE